MHGRKEEMGESEDIKLKEINSNIVYLNPSKSIATLNKNSLNTLSKCQKYAKEKSILDITL